MKLTNQRKTAIILLVLSMCFTFGCKQEKKESFDAQLYFGGDILTMKGATPTYTEALVVKEDKIAFVGTLNEAEKQFSNAKKVNLNSNTMLPGFIDGHAHFTAFSIQAIGAQILPPPDAGAKNIPELIKILKAWNTPENRALTGWVFGMGFDDSILEEKRFPTKHDLDEVTTEFPVMIVHISGHFAVVNSKGLEKIGYDASTKNPEGGVIRREEGSNEPNGVLEELAAIPYAFKATTPVTKEASDKFFEAGQNMALSYGYTTAQDGRTMKASHDMLAAASENDKLKLDVVSYIDYTVVDELMSTPWNSTTYNNHYRIGGMKVTLDGSPQGRTAWRTIPYLIPPDGQDANYKGYPAIPSDSTLLTIYEKGYKNNWQILSHTNGDAAADQLLRTMRKLEERYSHDKRRDVIIHGQYIRKDQLDDAKDLNLMVSLFPLHTFYWGDWHKQIIGDSLGNKISPTRTALDKGVKITIHTDAPVALPNLMRMVGISVERKSRSGQVIGADEKISAYEALQGITSWSAYQHFEEDSKGTLEVGKLADLVVLDKNPLKVPEADIKEILVLETIKEGKSVYLKPKK
ncbi:amidohydrolase [Tamlana fucoidanivorans]|uniref:Amidohydrolase n=1 Tax=Allotamlana fucoidanivorans TaxID=2583814 RepID=A0A5C4SLL1_9FLAO|nr:amidohydrolase [Tamlana fucoidanivorans]TNJ44300.1 amidohydrolase [Tamlana fucoidanivorans]